MIFRFYLRYGEYTITANPTTVDANTDITIKITPSDAEKKYSYTISTDGAQGISYTAAGLSLSTGGNLNYGNTATGTLTFVIQAKTSGDTFKLNVNVSEDGTTISEKAFDISVN